MITLAIHNDRGGIFRAHFNEDERGAVLAVKEFNFYRGHVAIVKLELDTSEGPQLVWEKGQ